MFQLQLPKMAIIIIENCRFILLHLCDIIISFTDGVMFISRTPILGWYAATTIATANIN